MIDFIQSVHYLPIMAYESAIEEALRPLYAQRDELRDKLLRIENAIAALTGDLTDTSQLHLALPASSEIREPSKIFEGMTQPEMAYETIKRNGKPMLAREILEVWKVHGVEPVGSDAVNKIQTAIKRRESQVGDLVHVGDGKWGVCSWYSPKEIERHRRDAGFHARDTAEHRKKMVAGIQAAKDRGAHYGSPPKITQEQWELACDLFRNGTPTVTSVHRELVKLTPDGVKPMVSNTLRKWVPDFKAGKPYPERWARYWASKKSEDVDPQPIARVVK